MSQVKFEIIKGKSELPPAKVRVIQYSGSDLSKDIYQIYRGVAIACKIINTDTTNSITVSIDGEPTFTVPKESLINLEDVQFTNLDISGTGSGEIVLKVISQNRLKTNQLIEVE